MRNLLLEELKRAVQLMEENPELTTQRKDGYGYFITDRKFVELEQTLHAIRRHSVAFIKQSRGKES